MPFLLLFLLYVGFGFVLWSRHENGAPFPWLHSWWMVALLVAVTRYFVLVGRGMEIDDAQIWEDSWFRYAIAVLLCAIPWAISEDANFAQLASSPESSTYLAYHIGIYIPLLFAAYFARELVFFVITAWLLIELIVYLLAQLPLVQRVGLLAIFVALVGLWRDQWRRRIQAEAEAREEAGRWRSIDDTGTNRN